jgi:hypothetical protein
MMPRIGETSPKSRLQARVTWSRPGRASLVGSKSTQPLRPAARPRVIVVAEDQVRRQQAFADQRLRPVVVGRDRIEQRGALGDAGGKALPFRRIDDLRQQVELPRPIGALGVGIHVVGGEQRSPLPTDVAVGVEQFVITPRIALLLFTSI